MSDTKLPWSDPFSSDLADDSDGTVRAIIVEDPCLVGAMLGERETRECDRCVDPNAAIAGMVFFWPTPPRTLVRLGKSEWALCCGCLRSLKLHGVAQFTGDTITGH
jgi:hypothetical protein